MNPLFGNRTEEAEVSYIMPLWFRINLLILSSNEQWAWKKQVKVLIVQIPLFASFFFSFNRNSYEWTVLERYTILAYSMHAQE